MRTCGGFMKYREEEGRKLVICMVHDHVLYTLQYFIPIENSADNPGIEAAH
jgi:hypothetical protein